MELMGTMGLVKLHFLALFPGEEVVPDTLHVNWSTESTGVMEGPIMEDLPGRRHVGPYGC